MVQKIKDNFQFIVFGFLLLVLFRQCGVNRDIDRIKKELRSSNVELNVKLNSINTLSKEEIRHEMNQVMFKFLIYEDDLDKKKISLSEIKNKIESSEE
jgi:hypothetical protein